MIVSCVITVKLNDLLPHETNTVLNKKLKQSFLTIVDYFT